MTNCDWVLCDLLWPVISYYFELETQYSRENKRNLCRDILKLLKSNLNEELNQEKIQEMLKQSRSLYKQISKMYQDLSDGSIPSDEQEETSNSPIFAKKFHALANQLPEDAETPRTCYESARQTLSTARTQSNTEQTTYRSAATHFEQYDSKRTTPRDVDKNISDEDEDVFFGYQAKTHRIEEVKDDFVESLDDPQFEGMATQRAHNPFYGLCQKNKKVPSISTTEGPMNSMQPKLLNAESSNSKSTKTQRFSDSNADNDEELEASEQQDTFEYNPSVLNRGSLSVPSQGERTSLSPGISKSYSMEIFNNIPTVRSISISTWSKNSSKRLFGKSFTNSNEVLNMTNDWGSLEIRCILSAPSRGKTYMVKNSDEIVVLKKFEMENSQENIEFLEHVKKTVNLLKELGLNRIVKHFSMLLAKGQGNNSGIIEYGIVSEYMAGGDLQDYLKGNEEAITFNKRKQLAFNLLLALEEMHANRLKHGNLKLRNCLLSNDHSELKLSDILINDHLADRDEDISLEDLKFMAPELREGEEEQASYRSDIWSLGICFIEIIAGPEKTKRKSRVPSYIHTEAKLNEEIERATNSITTDSQGKQAFHSLVKKCLVWNPEERASCKELLKHEFFSGM